MAFGSRIERHRQNSPPRNRFISLGGDASRLWFLELAPRDGGDDVLVQIDVANDSVVERVDLGGRVLNDQWEVNQTVPSSRFGVKPTKRSSSRR